MCEASVFVFAQAAGLIEVALHEHVEEKHACITTKRILDVYPGKRFYFTFSNIGKVNVHVPKHHKFGDVGDAPVRIVHIKNERFSYPSIVHVNNGDLSVNAVQYKPSPDRVEVMIKH